MRFPTLFVDRAPGRPLLVRTLLPDKAQAGSTGAAARAEMSVARAARCNASAAEADRRPGTCPAWPNWTFHFAAACEGFAGGSLLPLARALARGAVSLLRIRAPCFHGRVSVAFDTRCSSTLKKARDRPVRFTNGAACSHDPPWPLLLRAPWSFTRVVLSFARAARLFEPTARCSAFAA